MIDEVLTTHCFEIKYLFITIWANSIAKAETSGDKFDSSGLGLTKSLSTTSLVRCVSEVTRAADLKKSMKYLQLLERIGLVNYLKAIN